MRRSIPFIAFAAIAFFLVGCLYTPLAYDLPPGAVITQPSGRNLTYIAPGKGTIFLRDQPADAVIFTTPAEFGQELEVDAANDRVTFDKRPVVPARSLRPDGTYQIFFKPSE